MASSTKRGKNREGRMTLGEHFVELRKRLFRSAIGLLIGAVIGWFLAGWVLDALREPIIQIAKQQNRLAELNYDNITGAFDLKLQIAITIGVVISSPIWLYQIWAFFVPALSRKELKYGLGFFFTAVPLFLAGCAAGYRYTDELAALVDPEVVEVPLLNDLGGERVDRPKGGDQQQRERREVDHHEPRQRRGQEEHGAQPRQAPQEARKPGGPGTLGTRPSDRFYRHAASP